MEISHLNAFPYLSAVPVSIHGFKPRLASLVKSAVVQWIKDADSHVYLCMLEVKCHIMNQDIHPSMQISEL